MIEVANLTKHYGRHTAVEDLSFTVNVAFGALMRNTATAIGILFAILFVVPVLFETLGGVWDRASEYLPGEAGQAMITVVSDSGDMSSATGLRPAAGVGGRCDRRRVVADPRR